MQVPVWLTLAIALLVFGFGAYRIRLALRPQDPADRSRPRRGFYAMGRSTHLLIGTVYLLLGAALVAAAFGWSPVGGLFGPRTAVPSKDQAPTRTGIPVDQLPQHK